MSPASPLLRGASKRLAQIDQILEQAYMTPRAELGNKDDPLDEAIYMVLSFQTDLPRVSDTWSKLRNKYRTWNDVAEAPATELEHVLREAGLHRQKTRTIKQLLHSVKELSGALSLDFLHSMSTDDAERVLLRLPGLSWKGARCILLYSLGREAFPVDVNTFRILKRTGVISPTAVYRRRSLHDALQSAVPTDRRGILHVNLVVHGQRTCLPRAPKCPRCPLKSFCPMIGIPQAKTAASAKGHAKTQRHRARPTDANTNRKYADRRALAADEPIERRRQRPNSAGKETETLFAT
jgi:endonuclease III